LLARSHGCEVISRASAAAFAKSGGTIRDAGRELDVRYIIEGEIRTAGTALRISASLVDTVQDKVIWSDAFEANIDDISSVSQSLAEKVASYLGIELTRAEVHRSRRRPRSRKSRDLLLRARGIQFDEGLNRASFGHAAELLEKAIKADPENADAHALLSVLMALSSNFGFSEPSDEYNEKMLLACQRALEIDDPSSEVLGYVGCAYCDVQRFDQGLPLLDRAIELDPSNAQAKAALGTSLIIKGRLEEGVVLIEEALRLSPAYKGIAAWATVLAGAYLMLDRLAEASSSISQALRCDPTFYPTHLTAALLALKKGDMEAAERHAREAKRIDPQLDARATIRVVGRKAAEVLGQWLGLESQPASKLIGSRPN
jgi:tetratricopeptide (TPR) repeat protein